MNKTAIDLQHRVLAFIARGLDVPTSDDEFDELARAVFAFQFAHNAVYRAFCEQQHHTPQTVEHWKEIPAVPTSAFKDFDISCFPPGEAVAQFHTSGTTREQTGRHYFPTLELYEAAIVPNFAAHLLPDSAGSRQREEADSESVPVSRPASSRRRLQMRMFILTPSPDRSPHSSLSHMMGVVCDKFGTADSAFYVEDNTLLIDRLLADLRRSQEDSQPAILLGTAFAFVHLFDACVQRDVRLTLPVGSRAMETGGFKGRSREMTKPELYAQFEKFLGLPPAHIVNEYGMTELSTQFYDQSLRVGRQTDLKVTPPWARAMIIDPNTGHESAQGEPGLIRVFDLANVWSAACIQTEDLGIARPAGFEIIGRLPRAESRGCSLTAENFT